MIPFKKILCPTDFSKPSYEALKQANELALRFSAELCVIHVILPVRVPTLFPASPTTMTFDIPSYQQELVASSQNVLDELVSQKVPKELHVRPIVVHGHPADQIVQIANEEKADLIVIGSHGETGWRRFISGSVAEKVVRLASCPVLTVQAPPKEGR